MYQTCNCYIRQKLYEDLNLNQDICLPRTYRQICGFDAETLNKVEQEFYTDSHALWPEEEQSDARMRQAKEKWDKVARQTKMQMEQKEKGRMRKANRF